MGKGVWRRGIAAVLWTSVVLGAVSIAATGCSRKKATIQDYGPGSQWVDSMREQIRKNVDDPDKVAGLLAVVDQIELTLTDMDADVRSYYASLKELDRSYNTTTEEFQDTIGEFDLKRREYFEKILDYIFDMKRIAGKKDWEKVSDIDESLYQSWQRSFGS